MSFRIPTRRSGVRLIALALAAVLLAGCGGGAPASQGGAPQTSAPAPSAPAAQPAGQPKPGGTFTFPVIDNPKMWPITGGLPNILANKLLYSSLVKYNEKDLSPTGDLAETWKVSADGKTWTFSLRKNAKWHDGKPVTADDVVFTVNQVWLNPKVPYYLRSNIGFVDRAEKVDDHTVNVILKSVAMNLDVQLGYLQNVLPKHIMADWAPEKFANPVDFLKNPVGSGPFKFAEAVPGSHVKLVRFDDYFLGKPLLDAVVIKVIPDIEQQLAQLRTGQLDMLPLEPHQLEAVQKDPNLRIVEAKQVNYTYVGFNNKLEPFTDKRLRQALTYAVDRQAILKDIYLGKGKLANGPINPLLDWAYNPGARQYEYDVKKAEALLDEAGWKKGSDGIRAKDGKKLSVVLEVDRGNPTREQTAVVVQDAWKKIGVDATIKTSEFNALLSRVRAGAKADVQAWVMWYITPPDPDVTAYYGSGKSTNTFFYSNKEVDQLLEQGQKETDAKKRGDGYKRMQEIIAEEAPVVFLYFPAELQGLSKKVQGWPDLGYRDALLYVHKVWKN